jgi:hypothetical protein
MNFLWTIAAFILTLFIFSYLLGDNPLFRIASYLFIGVTAGYVGVMVFYYVLWPRLFYPLVFGSTEQMAFVLVPLLLSILMLAKLFPPLSGLGDLSVGYLLGVGAAVMIGGSVIGTLFTQVAATIHSFSPEQDALLEGSFLLFGTVSTLAYFHFSGQAKPGLAAKRPMAIEVLSKIGEIFIAITLGALFAGVYLAALSALIDRLDFIKTVILSFF